MEVIILYVIFKYVHIFNLFSHIIVQAIELMIVDALVKANDYLHISSHIEHPSQYWKVGMVFLLASTSLIHGTMKIISLCMWK